MFKKGDLVTPLYGYGRGYKLVLDPCVEIDSEYFERTGKRIGNPWYYVKILHIETGNISLKNEAKLKLIRSRD